MSNNNIQRPKHKFFRGKVLPRVALMFVPLPKRTFCSIDVTARCNLRCSHCYHFAHEQPQEREFTIDEWITKIRLMQARKPYFSCTWVGGEPLLKPELIAKGKKFFRSNRVVTNGTIPLPNWPDVEFHVSVDGTEELHDQIRGAGCFAKIKKNISNSEYQNLKIAVACCINKKNVDCIEDMIREWHEVKNIRHVIFDFMTPMKDDSIESLWLDLHERDLVIEKLNGFKKKYGDFIGVPPDTFNLMKSGISNKSIGSNCVFVKNGVAFDAWGNRKSPCVMGPKADCSRCGCVVPFSVRAWKKPSNLLREIIHSFGK